MSGKKDVAFKQDRDAAAAKISETLKDVPVVGYRDADGVLVLPADDEDY